MKSKVILLALVSSAFPAFASAQSDFYGSVSGLARMMNLNNQKPHASMRSGPCEMSLKKNKDLRWEISVVNSSTGVVIRDELVLYALPQGMISASMSWQSSPPADGAYHDPNDYVRIDLKRVSPTPRWRRYSLTFTHVGGPEDFRGSALRVEEWNGFGTFAKKTLDFKCR